MNNYVILSDIHGNLQALQAVCSDFDKYSPNGIILLGDLIDYGMQSNEVVDYLRAEIKGQIPVICNIWGNHEKEILEKSFLGFSSKRGEESARYTESRLREDVKSYLNSELDKRGLCEFFVGNMKCLAIHGSKEDAYWKSVAPGDLKGDYSEYDIVFSGHSHISHCFNFFYPTENPKRRNKKAVLFINPGSVGQPRNHNPKAQYAVLDMDTLSVSMRAVTYDINGAMSMFDGSVDDFYRERLEYGV